MSIETRRQREKENLRHEILDAARELFVAEGYENVSMRKIADKIEYSPTTIYLYFKDKTELLHEICEASFARLVDELIRSRDEGGDPLEVLRRGLLAYIDFGLSNPHHYNVVFISPKEKYINSDDHPYEGSMGQRAFEVLAGEIVACMEAGVVKRADVATVAQTLWAGIHGVTSLLITHDGFPFVDRNVLEESVVDTMIAGLRA
jgi:AcrR family transcriptional regulator